MGRLGRSQLLLGDNVTARDLGLQDGLEDRTLEPGQVPRNCRGAYSAGYAMGQARRARQRGAVES